jgi:hypothetical protein
LTKIHEIHKYQLDVVFFFSNIWFIEVKIASFDGKEKEEVLLKQKTGKVTAVCKDKTTEAIFIKAALALSDEKDFDEFIKSLEVLNKAVEDSSLFKEVGKDGKKTETDNSLLTLIQKKFKQDK